MNSPESLQWSKPLFTVGVGLSAFTSGTIASMSLITVPTLLKNATNASLLGSWKTSLDSGVKVAPPLAVAAAIAHALNTYVNRNSATNRPTYFAAAAASTIAIVPFTMFVLGPTNQELFKREEAARTTTTAAENTNVDLVKRWGRLNLIRAVLPALGALVACLTL